MKNILIILAVVVVASVVYFAFVNKSPQVAQQTSTPTPTKTSQATKSPTATVNPTADWKTYTNTQYGFEFKYPTRMSEKSFPDWLTTFTAGSGGSVGLNIKSGTLSKDKVVSIYGPVPTNQINEKQIAGQTAYYFNEGDAGCGGHKYFIPLKNNYLIMQFSDCEDQTPHLTLQEEDQILSTFKLTK